MPLLSKLRFYPTSLLLRLKLAAARNLLDGPFRWWALDALGIHGHGLELIRAEFLPAPTVQPVWGYDNPTHPELTVMFNANVSDQITLLRTSLATAADYRAWPASEDATEPALPWRDNEYLSPLDMAVLYGMLRHLRPERYLEIGSGISTRVAWQARRMGGFTMEIVSIDPHPRVAIATLCDHIYRSRLEEISTDKFLSLVTPRTVIFFDGSHLCLPGSDVTVFFLNLFPRLPSGTVVHIHDVYLPGDYPLQFFNRHWSEQYLLAAFLLGGGKRIEILLPCAFLESKPEVRALITSALGTTNTGGSSFWLRMI